MRVRGLYVFIALMIVAACLGNLSSSAQSSSYQLLALINNTRRTQGLHPYAFNSSLTSAAVRHSQDMAALSFVEHVGSDGSSGTQRMLEAGYGAYDFGPVVAEGVFGGTGDANVPFNLWMSVAIDRENILHNGYREVGIAVAYSDQGWGYWTICYGAQPSRLPVFVNDGIGITDSPAVSLTLAPENIVPEGSGTAMGQPSAYRASTNDQFEGVIWQPWASQVAFNLDEMPGQQTVYVQVRDDAGRTSLNWTTVRLSGEQPTALATPTRQSTESTPTKTPRTTPTRTPTPSRTPTRTKTATPSPTATASATATIDTTATLTTTLTPSPTLTITPTAVPATSAPTTKPPTPSSTLSPPTPTHASTALSTMTATSLAFVTSEPVADDALEASSASKWLPWVLGLQTIALGLGVYVALRRFSTER